MPFLVGESFRIRHAWLTCEYGGLDQLHELVDLDEDIDRHLQFATILFYFLRCISKSFRE